MVMKMGKIKSDKVCAFCAELSTQVNNKAEVGVKALDKFYSNFLTTALIDTSDNIRSRKLKSNSNQNMGKVKIPDKWTVCGKCLPECQLALEAKEKVDKVESQVRKMQIQLLIELDKLFGEIEGMTGHLKNIEQSVIKVKSFENSGRPTGRSSLRRQKENDEFIGILQDKLIKALQDIRLFQTETSRKLLNNPEETLSGQVAEIPTGNVDPVVKIESADLTNDHEESLEDWPNLDDNSPDNYSLDEDNEMTVDVDESQVKIDDKSDPIQEEIDALSFSDESEDDQDTQTDDSSDADFDPDMESYPSTSASVKGMSKFRRNFIGRIRNRHTIATSNTLPKSISDPRRPFHIKYKESKFFLEDFEILVLDTPEILQCASCLFQVQNPTYCPRKANHPEDQMFEHILSKHLLLYTCTTCCKSFETLYILRSHKLTHLEPDLKPTVPCPICEKPISSSSAKNLKEHQWTHLNAEEKQDPQNAHLMPTKIRQYFVEGRKNECATCGKDFINKYHLKMHEKTHLSLEERREDKVICPICGRGVFQTSFRAHQRMCGKEKEGKVRCPVCEMKIKNKKWLDKHAAECHPGEKIFKCGICSKMYGTSAHLHNHMESHDKIKKYVCDGCGLGYQQKRNLKRHKVSCRVGFKREIN